MEDIAAMVDLFYESPSIGGMMKMMNIDMKSLVAKFPMWMNTMTELQTFDTSRYIPAKLSPLHLKYCLLAVIFFISKYITYLVGIYILKMICWKTTL